VINREIIRKAITPVFDLIPPIDDSMHENRKAITPVFDLIPQLALIGVWRAPFLQDRTIEVGMPLHEKK
jgi:hypothetical protein